VTVFMCSCNFGRSYCKLYPNSAHLVSRRQSVSECTKRNLCPLQNKSSCVTRIDFLKTEQEISNCDKRISYKFVAKGLKTHRDAVADVSCETRLA